MLESIEVRTDPVFPPCDEGLVAGAENALLGGLTSGLGAVTGLASSAVDGLGLGAVADAVREPCRSLGCSSFFNLRFNLIHPVLFVLTTV